MIFHELSDMQTKWKGKNVSLCIVNETWEEGKNELPKHFLYIKDLSDFKHRIFR